MNFYFSNDIKAIREMLGLTQAELAEKLGVQQITISRNETGQTEPSERLLELVYSFAFSNNIKLGKLKEMLWLENLKPGHKLLLHGAKSVIEGELSAQKSRTNNDFGQGFYTGENYEQAVSFVSSFDRPSIYYLDLDAKNLRCKEYKVNRDWMMTIAYYRGTLDEYADHPMIKKLVAESRDCDYIIAPIADNRMFQIINSFIIGEITDEQCKHCLAATNLGNQYIFVSDKSVKRLKILERSYVADNEREYYRNLKIGDAKLGEDKVKLARIRYRGKGKYIDEILK